MRVKKWKKIVKKYDTKQGHQEHREQEHQHKKEKMNEWKSTLIDSLRTLSRYEAGNYSIKGI